MKIYFIRHGIAQAYAQDDFHRDLTTEGRVKCNQKFRTFAKAFPRNANVTICTSPLVRAVETTKILSRNLSRPFSVEDFMVGCSTEKLLCHLDSGKDYILVGHEPHISKWIYDLTGKFVTVSRCSIHGVEMQEGKGSYFEVSD